MLDHLTTEQQELMIDIKDKYLNSFFSSHLVDREKAKKLYSFLYSLCDLHAPSVIFVNNPYELQVAANLIKESNGDIDIHQNYDRVNLKKIEYFQTGYYGDCSDLGWIAYYEYFSKIGIVKHPKFQKIIDNVDGLGFLTIQLYDVCLVCENPSFIHRDPQNRLHNTVGPAIGWNNLEMYYVHGIYFTSLEFEKYIVQTPTYAELNAITNVEKRTAILMEKLEIILENDKSVSVVDEVDKYEKSADQKFKMTLYHFDYEGTSQHALLLHDHSTSKPNIHLVPNNITKCLEAWIWMRNDWKDDYDMIA